MPNNVLCLALAFTLALEPMVKSAEAQPKSQDKSVPRSALVVAIVDPFPYGMANAVIVRRAGVPDLVAVRNDRIDALLLARAVQLTQVLRAAYGTVAGEAALYRVPTAGGPTPYDVEAKDWEVYLRAAKLRSVPGLKELGAVRSLRLQVADEGFRLTQASDNKRHSKQ